MSQQFENKETKSQEKPKASMSMCKWAIIITNTTCTSKFD